jgi:hypothetical protein
MQLGDPSPQRVHHRADLGLKLMTIGLALGLEIGVAIGRAELGTTVSVVCLVVVVVVEVRARAFVRARVFWRANSAAARCDERSDFAVLSVSASFVLAVIERLDRIGAKLPSLSERRVWPAPA